MDESRIHNRSRMVQLYDDEGKTLTVVLSAARKVMKWDTRDVAHTMHHSNR
jgi:hypothetical protein